MSANVIHCSRLPDECLYSLGARIHRLCGFSRPRETSRQLYGDPRSLFHHYLPVKLGEFQSRSREVYGRIEELIRDSTLVPFFTWLRPQSDRMAALGLVKSGQKHRLEATLGLPGARAAAFLPLTYCRACAEEDRDKHGEAYWHRCHQLPGALVCTKHREVLFEAARYPVRPSAAILALPGSRIIEMAATCDRPTGLALERLIEIAEVQFAMLTEPDLLPIDPMTLRCTYEQGLRDRGLLTSSGSVRLKEYLAAVIDYFGDLKDIRVFSTYFSGKGLTGFLRPKRTKRGELSPITHSLLIAFLWGNWKGFEASYRWQSAITRPESASLTGEQEKPKRRKRLPAGRTASELLTIIEN